MQRVDAAIGELRRDTGLGRIITPAHPRIVGIGCICMDGTPQDDKGRGACAGFGGVRFWLYQNGDSIIMDPTRRHYSHPNPFTEEEKERLAAYNEGERVAFGSGRRLGDDFANIVMVMMVCITIGYVARLYFTHGAD